MGFRCEAVEKGRVVFVLDLRPEQCNSIGVAHGGALLAFFDTALGAAARANDAEFTRVATLDISASFLRAGKGRLTAHARVLRGGRSIVFCEGEILDATGALVAKAIGTFKYDSPRQ
jgi:uncharacterized protein (TIGR00369 family)